MAELASTNLERHPASVTTSDRLQSVLESEQQKIPPIRWMVESSLRAPSSRVNVRSLASLRSTLATTLP